MSSLFIAPHNDDEGLFGTYIISALKLPVIVVYGGNQHERKFGESKGVKARLVESQDACKLLNVPMGFLGFSDEEYNVDKIVEAFGAFDIDEVFAPAKQGGNRHHDIVSEAADKVFKKVTHYATYTKDDLTPRGTTAIMGDPKLKERVLACYVSQHDINKPHFDAVKGVPEWLL